MRRAREPSGSVRDREVAESRAVRAAGSTEGNTSHRISSALQCIFALYTQRQGQLNLACSNCQDVWDKRLAGSAITQGQATGYPLYRLEWQTLGSLQRRLRACLTGIRAQPYDYGSPELVDLESYLMSRAKGMPMESPAVRP
ncbi:hypothetical protein ES707_04959 [subsurface metagenome]